MKKSIILIAMMTVLAFSAGAQEEVVDRTPALAVPDQTSGQNSSDKAEKKEAVKEHIRNHFKFYGFIRNYFAYDSRESKSGTGDLYYWLPLDRNLNENGEDMNRQDQFRFLAITTRLGVDVSGYKVGKTEFGAKVEADFYAGLDATVGGKSGNPVDRVSGTAQLRLRQAYATVGWRDLGREHNGAIFMKIGQAWHPMAADLPDIFSLESGAPFNAFSRTPQFTTDFHINQNWSLTASLIWQMQYKSAGPEGATANYIKYSCTPEVYAGVNFKKDGFLARIGLDVLSIKPRHTYTPTDGEGKPVSSKTVKVKDRITTLSPFIYLQYTKGLFKLKAKSIYGAAGEHINLMSGYAVTSKEDMAAWEYTPLHNSSSWVTIAYGKKLQGAILGGYVKNLGTDREIVGADGKGDASCVFFQTNGSSNINQMYRIQPEITYNVGKFTVGLEYMMTAVQYGDSKSMDMFALCTGDLHWIYNHRVQAMVKFNF